MIKTPFTRMNHQSRIFLGTLRVPRNILEVWEQRRETTRGKEGQARQDEQAF